MALVGFAQVARRPHRSARPLPDGAGHPLPARPRRHPAHAASRCQARWKAYRAASTSWR